jgi:hypothetical protein
LDVIEVKIRCPVEVIRFKTRWFGVVVTGVNKPIMGVFVGIIGSFTSHTSQVLLSCGNG